MLAAIYFQSGVNTKALRNELDVQVTTAVVKDINYALGQHEIKLAKIEGKIDNIDYKINRLCSTKLAYVSKKVKIRGD